MATLTLRRTGRTVSHGGSKGEISELKVGDTQLWAVERRDGYITLDDGTYTVQMENSPNHPGRRQLRVLDHQKITKTGEPAAILIHVGNYPDQVTGCIGPGTTLRADGVDNSNEAMEQIFKALGGFKPGGTGTLIVTSGQSHAK